MFSTFCVLFSVFPGVLIKPKLFSFGPGIKINLILFTFNFFDTIGRKLAQNIPVTALTSTIFTFVRIPLAIFACYTSYLDFKGANPMLINLLTLLNPALLAVTNGIACNLLFALGPSQVPDEFKGRAGSSMSFFLVVGLFVGSVLSMKVEGFLNFKK